MIAVVLAGGKGTRFDMLDSTIPKPLLHIDNRPVISWLVEKLLRLDEVASIYILTPENQTLPDFPDGIERILDLKTSFLTWKNECHDSARERIEIIFEDDLPCPRSDDRGAIMGLYCFLLWLEGDQLPRRNTSTHLLKPPVLANTDSILVFAADNFFEDDLTGLIEMCHIWPKAIINACADFQDREKIRLKYGTVELDDLGWATGYEEKPTEVAPNQTRVSAAIYAYPFEQFRRLQEYISVGYPYGVDAPGNLLKWFVRDVYSPNQTTTNQQHEKGRGVRGYILCGRWFDIGQKADLDEATGWYEKHRTKYGRHK